MPTYEYECGSCGHRYELVQRMSDPPRKRCPECGKKVERLIGAGAGLLFKGSGFYITDYRSPEYRAKAKAESASHAPAPGGSGAPSEGGGAASGAGKTGSGTGGKTGGSTGGSTGGKTGGSTGGEKTGT